MGLKLQFEGRNWQNKFKNDPTIYIYAVYKKIKGSGRNNMETVTKRECLLLYHHTKYT